MERNTIIAIILLSLLIFGLLIYGILKRTSNSPEQTATINKWFKYLLIIFIISVVIAFVIWYMTRNKSDSDYVKTLPPDEVFAEVKKRMVFKEGVKGYHDENGNLQIPDNAIKILDHRPFVSTGSGEEFMLYEIHFRNPFICPNTGTRTINIPLNRHLRLVKGGLYTQHFQTGLFNWVKNKSYLKKLPLTTPQKESLKIAQFATEQDIDLDKLQSIYNNEQPQQNYPVRQRNQKKNKQQNIDYIGEPIDED
jgi:hypothetical protein